MEAKAAKSVIQGFPTYVKELKSRITVDSFYCGH